jgi:phenylpropionate dioxygenase-like ring-hydroxylating dioxygenase large terminal subunit
MSDLISPPVMPSVQDVLDTDPIGPPQPLRVRSQRSFGLADISTERYLSREFHDLEVRRLWGRVWQWACREEDIPNVGDYVVYDIADRSVIVVRTDDDEIKGYYNSCLHRGTQLKQGEGSCSTITCPFHAWSWHLDGRIRRVPARWDFPQKQDPDLTLPEVRLERWAGFVFVNFDPRAAPLAEFLDVLPGHFEHFPALRDRFTALHVSKVMPGNWKIVLEAFAESYHTIGTHPALLTWIGDENSQCDVWDTTSRLISLSVVPSPHLDGAYDDDSVYHDAMAFFAPEIAEEDRPELPPGTTPRAAVAAHARRRLGERLGLDFSAAADTEMLDTLEYFLFPNWMPWAGVGLGTQYRFRPNGNDPDTSIMDIRFMLPLPAAGERPPPAPVIRLGLEQEFTEIPELAPFSSILIEDTSNLPLVQRGMKASATGTVAFSEYQESRIRHFHALLDLWLAEPEEG